MYGGSATGKYTDANRSVLRETGFWIGFDAAEVISTAVFDCNGARRPDLLLGGYCSENPLAPGMQLLVNIGSREFVDETRERIGESAWSLTEAWQQEHRFLN